MHYCVTKYEKKELVAGLAVVELNCPAQLAQENRIALSVDLAFGRGHITIDEFRVPLELCSARLRIRPQGGQLDHRSAYGRHPKPAADHIAVKFEETRKEGRSTHRRLGGTAGLDLSTTQAGGKMGAEVAAKVSAESDRDRSETRTGQREDRAPRVSYQMYGWELKEPGGETLKGIYMGDSETPAIKINCTCDTVEIIGWVECEGYELFVDVTNMKNIRGGGVFKKHPNNKKIFCIMLQKSLKQKLSGESDGPMVIAQSCLVLRTRVKYGT